MSIAHHLRELERAYEQDNQQLGKIDANITAIYPERGSKLKTDNYPQNRPSAV